MIWATVSSPSCFCWLYRASPYLAAKNIINLISVLTIWWCPCVESSLVLLEESVCYDQCILLVKLKNPQPWNLLAYSFIIKEQVRRGEHLCFAMISVFSWENSINLCPASFSTPRPNLPVTPGISWLPTFGFHFPLMKRTSSWGC